MSVRLFIVGLLLLISTTAATAANNLQFGPPPTWVTPVPLPPAGSTTQAAVKLLLMDQQIKLTPNTITDYVELAAHIQTPQGLSTAGTVTAVWNPDTDVMTINKVEIHRGDQVINVLSSGQTFTIAKREVNLDYATLDDTLTAVLEPADLQVGDTLDIAYTLEHTDPVLAGTPEAELAIPTTVPISKVYISALWPTTEPIKWQATKDLAGIKLVHGSTSSGITLTLNDVQPILQPKGAPLRFLVTRRIDFTAFGSWAQLAQRFAPLYQHAATLPAGSPLQAEITRISTATPDPKQRAAMALMLVEDKVRYVLLAMNQGGLIPASADLTWSRRFGDCKAKTALLLALLHGLGIKAEPVFVNILVGGGMDSRLPMIELFNHVLVRTVIDGNTYWLDGTRVGDTQLDRLHEPFYHWGLPLLPDGAQLVRMMPPPLSQPQVETLFSIDATGGVAQPAPVHVQKDFHGEAGIFLKTRLDNLTPAQLDQALRTYWSQKFTDVKIKAVSVNYDQADGIERLTMDGTQTMDWSGGEHTLGLLSIGYDADFTRGSGPNQDAPYAVAYPYYSSTTEMIKLPLGGEDFSITNADTERTLAGMAYQRHVHIDGGILTGTVSVRSVEPEFPSSEAVADQEALKKLADTNVDVEAPSGHVPTAKEIAWGLPKSNSTTRDFFTSGYDLLNHNLYGDALEDFNAALALDARNSWALAFRGQTYVKLGDYASANQDFKQAVAIDQHNYAAFDGLGLLASGAGDDARAIAAFTTAIHLNPQDDSALSHRALEYWRTDKVSLALADLDTAVHLKPDYLPAYWLRALIFGQQGKKAEAVHQAKLVLAAAPGKPAGYVEAAAIYAQFGEHALATATLDHWLAAPDTVESYLVRSQVRPWSDLAGRRADIESALKLDPTSTAALLLLTNTEIAAGDFSGATASLASLKDKFGQSSEFLTLRAIIYDKTGRTALASTDLAEAKLNAKNPAALNNICWELATAGVSLTTALDDCNAALAKPPGDANTLDSRGFVLMKLGRCDDAISNYNAALKIDSFMPTALYGRGICELHKGMNDAGHADIRTAMAISSKVADDFAHYGIRP